MPEKRRSKAQPTSAKRGKADNKQNADCPNNVPKSLKIPKKTSCKLEFCFVDGLTRQLIYSKTLNLRCTAKNHTSYTKDAILKRLFDKTKFTNESSLQPVRTVQTVNNASNASNANDTSKQKPSRKAALKKAKLHLYQSNLPWTSMMYAVQVLQNNTTSKTDKTGKTGKTGKTDNNESDEYRQTAFVLLTDDVMFDLLRCKYRCVDDEQMIALMRRYGVTPSSKKVRIFCFETKVYMPELSQRNYFTRDGFYIDSRGTIMCIEHQHRWHCGCENVLFFGKDHLLEYATIFTYRQSFVRVCMHNIKSDLFLLEDGMHLDALDSNKAYSMEFEHGSTVYVMRGAAPADADMSDVMIVYNAFKLTVRLFCWKNGQFEQFNEMRGVHGVYTFKCCTVFSHLNSLRIFHHKKYKYWKFNQRSVISINAPRLVRKNIVCCNDVMLMLKHAPWRNRMPHTAHPPPMIAYINTQNKQLVKIDATNGMVCEYRNVPVNGKPYVAFTTPVHADIYTH